MPASKTLILSYLLAFAEARFGQEQIPISAISSLSNFGSPGQAATLAGSVPGVLLAAANPCAKLQLADKIVSTLGSDSQVISAAAQLVAAERNFNPFAVSVDSFCASANLPATQELRGILPLVDPAVTGSDVENANSKTSLTTPFNAVGLSVAQVAIAQGFSNFTAVDSTGNKVALSGATTGGTGSGNTNNGGAAATSSSPTTLLTATRAVAAAAASGSSSSVCFPVTRTVTVTPSSAATGATNGATNNNQQQQNNANKNKAVSSTSTSSAASSTGTGSATSGTVAGKGAGQGVTTSISGADFGSCNPTIRREGGLNGRPATEFTFQANDPKIEKIQQEALNPNIITNRICDELTNQCGANAQAKQVCQDAKAKVLAIGAPTDRSDSTVTIWNSALGF